MTNVAAPVNVTATATHTRRPVDRRVAILQLLGSLRVLPPYLCPWRSASKSLAGQPRGCQMRPAASSFKHP